MTKALLAIDQGTTSSRAIVFCPQGEVLACAQKEFEQHYPRDGWVEHAPSDIWNTILEVCRDALAQAEINPSDLIAAGITNQRETTLIWDRNTGEAVYPAIVWQDRRTAAFCARLKKEKKEALVRKKTGLLLDPYFSGTKIRWILDNVEGAREKAEAGELLTGTVDSFLIWHLTKGRVHATDATNASRTLLFNIHKQTWDPELLELFGIPASLLPDVRDSAGDFGHIDADWLGAEVPIRGVAGDQQAALIGQACFSAGMCKSTYGTGCFLVMNTGELALTSSHNLLTTVAYRINGKTTYALEGSIFMAGATIQWLRDAVKLIDDAAESLALAQQVGSRQSVYLVPAFTGLGAPHWDPNARGTLAGMTRNTGIPEIVTAGLQSVAYQTQDLIQAIQDDGLAKLHSLRVDGGMAVNDWVLQFLADILQIPVERPANTETTALGAAYLAGLGSGTYKSLEHIAELWKTESIFSPDMPEEDARSLHQGWLNALEGTKTISRLNTGCDQ